MRMASLILLLAAALLCYLLGAIHGAMALLIIGGLLELGFWLGLFRRFGKRVDRNPS